MGRVKRVDVADKESEMDLAMHKGAKAFLVEGATCTKAWRWGTVPMQPDHNSWLHMFTSRSRLFARAKPSLSHHRLQEDCPALGRLAWLRPTTSCVSTISEVSFSPP